MRARLSGTLAEPTDTAGPEIAFDVTAPAHPGVTPWLGFSSASDSRVALKGTVLARRRGASLTGASLLVGQHVDDRGVDLAIGRRKGARERESRRRT